MREQTIRVEGACPIIEAARAFQSAENDDRVSLMEQEQKLEEGERIASRERKGEGEEEVSPRPATSQNFRAPSR